MESVTTLGVGVAEIIENRLISIADEMKEVVMRSSVSPLWREAGDLSCGVLTPNGELLAQGSADIPVHLGTLPSSVRGALDRIDPLHLRPGDAILHNLPEAGNNHLPDCLLLAPVFLSDVTIAFVAVRAHWLDIGGMAPGGSDPTATEAVQEGLRIPPTVIVREGVIQQDLLNLILANVRGAEDRYSDFLAQLAGCIRGVRRMAQMLDRYGADAFEAAAVEALDGAELRLRGRIAQLPTGSYDHVEEMDPGGDDGPRITVKMTVDGSSLLFDFAGSSREQESAVNCPMAVTSSAVYYAVKAVLDPSGPSNSGAHRPIQIRAPSGSIVNARPHRAVTASNTVTGPLIASAVLGALAKATPELAPAGDSSTSGGITIAGWDETEGNERYFVFREVHAGAGGALSDLDGASAMRVGVGNTGNTPVEVVEAHYPLIVERSEVAWEARAEGAMRGGAPLRRVYRITCDKAVLSITGARTQVRARGVNGGDSGAPARYVINPGGVGEVVLGSLVGGVPLRRDDRLLIQCGSGGAHGLRRDPS